MDPESRIFRYDAGTCLMSHSHNILRNVISRIWNILRLLKYQAALMNNAGTTNRSLSRLKSHLLKNYEPLVKSIALLGIVQTYHQNWLYLSSCFGRSAVILTSVNFLSIPEWLWRVAQGMAASRAPPVWTAGRWVIGRSRVQIPPPPAVLVICW